MIRKIIKGYKKLRFSTTDYWENRYRKGGNSGSGSYGKKATYKASVVNEIIKKYDISFMLEFGCGDGNNLHFFEVDRYLGFDISKSAIEICIKKYLKDQKKSFIYYQPNLFKAGALKAELTVSLEVIFHLIEDSTFQKYMNDLFESSSKYVLVCSTNEHNKNNNSIHLKHRKFTNHIPSHFSLLEHIETPSSLKAQGFLSDFYLFRRNF